MGPAAARSRRLAGSQPHLDGVDGYRGPAQRSAQKETPTLASSGRKRSLVPGRAGPAAMMRAARAISSVDQAAGAVAADASAAGVLAAADGAVPRPPRLDYLQGTGRA